MSVFVLKNKSVFKTGWSDAADTHMIAAYTCTEIAFPSCAFLSIYYKLIVS